MNTPGATPNQSRQGSEGTIALRVDPHGDIYRFSNGVCRQTSRIPAPWRLVDRERYRNRYTAEYSWTPENALSADALILEAENQAFGIATPAVQRSGRLQEVIEVYLASPRLKWHGQTVAMEVLLATTDKWNWPKSAPVPLSDSFQSYAYSKEYAGPGARLVLVNRSLQAAVVCDDGAQSDLPNPFCSGFILLSSDETAYFKISHQALAKLQEVVTSIRDLAHAVRVDCPAQESRHG